MKLKSTKSMKKLYLNQFSKKIIYKLCFIFVLSVSLFDLYYYKIGRIFDYLSFSILFLLVLYLYLSKKIKLKKIILKFKIPRL